MAALPGTNILPFVLSRLFPPMEQIVLVLISVSGLRLQFAAHELFTT
jgi:hypothetical protein